MSRYWSVNVSMNGESLVTIESNCLSGKPEFTDEEAQVIRDAATHLKAFIGERQVYNSQIEASQEAEAQGRQAGEGEVTVLPQKTHERCVKGWHDDPDNSGMCIRCGVILDAEIGEDPNKYRRSLGLPDVPVEPCI